MIVLPEPEFWTMKKLILHGSFKMWQRDCLVLFKNNNNIEGTYIFYSFLPFQTYTMLKNPHPNMRKTPHVLVVENWTQVAALFDINIVSISYQDHKICLRWTEACIL